MTKKQYQGLVDHVRPDAQRCVRTVQGVQGGINRQGRAPCQCQHAPPPLRDPTPLRAHASAASPAARAPPPPPPPPPSPLCTARRVADLAGSYGPVDRQHMHRMPPGPD